MNHHVASQSRMCRFVVRLGKLHVGCGGSSSPCAPGRPSHPCISFLLMFLVFGNLCTELFLHSYTELVGNFAQKALHGSPCSQTLSSDLVLPKYIYPQGFKCFALSNTVLFRIFSLSHTFVFPQRAFPRPQCAKPYPACCIIPSALPTEFPF